MQIKHAIFVQGADIPLNQETYFSNLTQIARNPLAQVGVNLIPCATNARSFTEGLIKWNYSHSAALLATGITLQGLLKRLYIASSYNYPNLRPWGSSPLLDHWLSTESLEIIHIGASYYRKEKIMTIANWEPAQNFLRVCPNFVGPVNCEYCNKCLGTKAILELEGALKKYKTFHHPFTYRDYLRWAWVSPPHNIIPRSVFRKAVNERRWSVIPFAFLVHFSSLIRTWLDRCVPSWLRSVIRNRLFPLEKNPFYAPNLTDHGI